MEPMTYPQYYLDEATKYIIQEIDRMGREISDGRKITITTEDSNLLEESS